jgi:transcriptional regulator with XRE-family HTH domain
VITNERQFAITRTAADRFSAALKDLDQPEDGPSTYRDLQRSAIEAQLADLKEELAAYEAVRGGQLREVPIRSLLDVPRALIYARIAAGLTQRQLAERLGVREQQVQHDEANQYAGAGLARLHAIASVLSVSILGAAELSELRRLPGVPSQAELLGEDDKGSQSEPHRARGSKFEARRTEQSVQHS